MQIGNFYTKESSIYVIRLVNFIPAVHNARTKVMFVMVFEAGDLFLRIVFTQTNGNLKF